MVKKREERKEEKVLEGVVKNLGWMGVGVGFEGILIFCLNILWFCLL